MGDYSYSKLIASRMCDAARNGGEHIVERGGRIGKRIEARNAGGIGRQSTQKEIHGTFYA